MKYVWINVPYSSILKANLPQAVWSSFATVFTPSHGVSVSQLSTSPIVVLMVFPEHRKQEPSLLKNPALHTKTITSQRLYLIKTFVKYMF